MRMGREQKGTDRPESTEGDGGKEMGEREVLGKKVWDELRLKGPWWLPWSAELE